MGYETINQDAHGQWTFVQELEASVAGHQKLKQMLKEQSDIIAVLKIQIQQMQAQLHELRSTQSPATGQETNYE